MKWISVDEKLPDIPPKYYDTEMGCSVIPLSVQVIIATEEGVSEGTYFSNGKWSTAYFHDEKPTHWMPLPQSPIELPNVQVSDTTEDDSSNGADNPQDNNTEERFEEAIESIYQALNKTNLSASTAHSLTLFIRKEFENVFQRLKQENEKLKNELVYLKKAAIDNKEEYDNVCSELNQLKQMITDKKIVNERQIKRW